MKVNFGRFFTDLKIVQKSPFFGPFCFYKKSPSTFKTRPTGEKLPNLVTLKRWKETVAQNFFAKPVKLTNRNNRVSLKCAI
jgi:hypothetical protein